jgi:hypothetical protein
MASLRMARFWSHMNYKELAQQYGWMGYLMYRWKENDCPGGPLPDGVIDPTKIGEFAVPLGRRVPRRFESRSVQVH